MPRVIFLNRQHRRWIRWSTSLDFQTWRPLEDIDCPEMFADEIKGLVRWNDGTDVRSPAGNPVRLRFGLDDADV